jgi:hypothetical protein
VRTAPKYHGAGRERFANRAKQRALALSGGRFPPVVSTREGDVLKYFFFPTLAMVYTGTFS